MKIMSLVGARPQFVKEALLNSAVRATNAWEHILVHSGQHYDVNMSDVFFQELDIPEPKLYLNIGSGSHGSMTAAAIKAMEEALIAERPDALLVYGDTNTTLAGALAAVKLQIPVIHVEAGIRQEPRSMPEEINRHLTDHTVVLSNGLFSCCSQSAAQNLHSEGITKGIDVSGDVMFDLFKRMQPRFNAESECKKHKLIPEQFILVTLHRDFNVDQAETLLPILNGLKRLADETGLKIFFPVHPRTRKRMESFGWDSSTPKFLLTEPLGYIELMSLTSAAKFIVTDSGGLQKEAFYAGKRSLVIMPDTGWREITDTGWNILSNPNSSHVLEQGKALLSPHIYPGDLYGNGQAAERIVNFVRNNL